MVRASIRIHGDAWPFSAAPTPKDSPAYGHRFWAHILHEETAWSLIIELLGDFSPGNPCPADVHFAFEDAPHHLLAPGAVMPLSVGETVYGEVRIEQEP